MFLHLNIHENDPFKGRHWSFMSHRSQFEEMMIVNVCSGIASLSGEVSLAQGNVHFPNEPSNSQSFPKHSQINLQTTFLFLFQLTYLGSNDFMFYYMQYLNFPLSHVAGTDWLTDWLLTDLTDLTDLTERQTDKLEVPLKTEPCQRQSHVKYYKKCGKSAFMSKVAIPPILILISIISGGYERKSSVSTF